MPPGYSQGRFSDIGRENYTDFVEWASVAGSGSAATSYAPTGLTGATAASRYVGGTASGAPASGTFAVGDFIVDQSGKIQVCTVAGSPGTWTAGALPTGNTDRQFLGSVGTTATWQTAGDELQAGYLVNTGSLGADHFNGSALAGAWSADGAAYTTTVKNSVLSLTGTTGVGHITKAFTPGATSFTIETRVSIGQTQGATNSVFNRIALHIRDSTASEATGNAALIQVFGDLTGTFPATQVAAYTLAGGALTQRGTNRPAVRGAIACGLWIYLRMQRDASGNYSFFWSPDRVTWDNIGGGSFLDNFTVAAVGYRIVNDAGDMAVMSDFMDQTA